MRCGGCFRNLRDTQHRPLCKSCGPGRRQEQEARQGLCLEVLGERAEHIEALEDHAADMRAVFRQQLEEAVRQLADARAGQLAAQAQLAALAGATGDKAAASG